MTPNGDFPIVILKRGKHRSLIRRHPWVFSGAVKSAGTAGDGAVVKVCDSDGSFLAFGHYSPGSNIAIRLFAFEEGKELNEEFWIEKLRNAQYFRSRLPELSGCDSYRLIFAEGDGMPGVIVDVFRKTAVLQLRTTGVAALEKTIVGFLKDELGMNSIYSELEPGKGKWVLADQERPEAPAAFTENGLIFEADPAQGQKTGFFLDQRENRRLVRDYSAGRRAVDIFCYSGGFTVNALAGGAERVISVDASEPAISMVQNHVKLNGFPEFRNDCQILDAFEFLRNMQPGENDLIVLDPPAFTKHISTVGRAARGYKDINMQALKRIAQGGFLFTFSCSQHISKDLFQKIVFGAAADAGREVRIVRQLSQASDHPVNIYFPEGDYLKGLLLYVS